MTQQEKQINYMGPFITMVFLFFIVGFLTTANTQFQGPLKETFLSEVGGLKNTFATMGHRTKRFFQWSGKMGERF